VDVDVTNPIPQGTKYIEGSAEGPGSSIELTKTAPAPPSEGVVTAIKWIFKDKILPGEEQWVRFKVLVK
jgi:hypothetical protein